MFWALIVNNLPEVLMWGSYTWCIVWLTLRVERWRAPKRGL